MTERREREDGIAANQFVNASIIMGGITPEARQSAATAFLAGCSHVRTSAEWKALEALEKAIRHVDWFDHVTGWSVVRLSQSDRVFSALDELDRIRKEGESG